MSQRNFQHLSLHFFPPLKGLCQPSGDAGILPLKLFRFNGGFLFFARSAKERKVRIWKDYVAPTANLDQKDRQFVAKVSSQWTVPSLQQAHLLVWIISPPLKVATQQLEFDLDNCLPGNREAHPHF